MGCLALVAHGQTTERQYLSGKDRTSTVSWEFFCTGGRKSGEWTTIPVPSCWDMQGFGRLAYGKDDTQQPVEEGKYRHTFAVPAGWDGKRLFLVFEGVMTDTEVKVNGQTTGPVHQGGFYRFKYDVTPLVKPGASDNVLEVHVRKLSADPSINRAERQSDYWLFGGIFRPVYLEAVPREFVERVAIDAKANGEFSIDVFTPSVTAADKVDVELLDALGQTVGHADGSPNTTAATLKTRVDGVAQWTAETPNLYTAVVRLKAGDRLLHEVRQRFGFRTIEVRKGDGIYVNGRRVMLKGVCRHAFWPESGRTLSPEIDRNDINVIKDLNMNAVRMSHYPPDQSFLDLCDELGLYVLDELAGWQKSYDTPAATRLVGELIVRDVNHPSILFWDNGNEGGWNTAVDGEFSKWDPQKRPVLHPWALHDDVNTKHYPDYALLTKLLAGNDIVMPTEFLHGLYDGGIGAGLRDYWDAMRASTVAAGGFFWVLADEGMVRADEKGRMDVAGNAAPDGIVGPYRQKEGSFYTVKKIWSPVVIGDTLPAGFDGRLEVVNDYSFTSLQRVKFNWQLRRWHGPDDAAAGYSLVAEGAAPSPAIGPGEKGVLALPLPNDWNSADALSLTATDGTGREIWTWVWPVRQVTVAPNGTFAESPDARKGELRSGDTVLKIDPELGTVRSVTRGGKTIPLTNGPRLALGAPRPKATTAPATTTPTTAPVGRLTSATWTAGEDGWFRLDYAYDATGPCEFMGVTFDLPESSVKSAKWLGTGPYRVWKNRTEGGTLGVWENAYNNTITGWEGWQYPEFKGYFADLHWAKLTTDAGTITIAAETPGLFLHLLTPQLPPGNLPRSATAPFPDGTLSILHGIPAIGTKFNAADRHGPQSQPNPANGPYRGTLWFRFH
jgi:hypothetical protein